MCNNMPGKLNPLQIFRRECILARNPERLKNNGFFPQKPFKTHKNRKINCLFNSKQTAMPDLERS